MKTLIRNYTFDPLTKTITLEGEHGLKLEQILLVTNLSSNTIIYNFADNLLGGSVLDNEILLHYDTTTMLSTDPLQIFIDIENTDFIELNNLLREGMAEIVHQLQSIRNDGGMADVSGRVRCAVESLPTLGTCTNVTTLANATNIANMGGFALQQQYMSMTNQAWGNLRNKIIVS